MRIFEEGGVYRVIDVVSLRNEARILVADYRYVVGAKISVLYHV